MYDFLPAAVNKLLDTYTQKLQEIRLRENKPLSVMIDGEYYFLGIKGLSRDGADGLIITKTEIENIIIRCSNYSLYAVNEHLSRGFITLHGGIRVGVVGECVIEGGRIITQKNFSSLCVRIPHQIIGCGKKLYEKVFYDGVKNLLVFSPPGAGKTTILRDLARLLSINTRQNIFILDERAEIANNAYNLGFSSDIIKFCDKRRALEMAVRSMRADIIVTDEIADADTEWLLKAMSCGIKLLASAHADTADDITKKGLAVFEVYALLGKSPIGSVRAVYDKEFNKL